MKKKFWLVFGSFLLCGLAVAIILLSFVKCSPLKNASKNLTSYVIDAELDESLAGMSCAFFVVDVVFVLVSEVANC